MVSQIQWFRLSPQQRLLWQQPGPQRACCVVAIDGQLDRTALHTALQSIVERHELLRTTYQRVTGIKIPVQCITESVAFYWHTIDLQAASQAAQEETIQTYLHSEIERVISEQEPALRALFFVRSASSYMLLMSIPTLSADNETFTHLLREISGAYAHTEEEEVIQYLQFSEWQHDLLQSDEALEGQAYWLKERAAQRALLVLPGENSSSQQVATAQLPHVFTLQLSAELSTQIEEHIKQTSGDLSVFLLACWQTLLWRLTGVSDIVVSTTFNGRKHEELSQLPGACTTFLPIHSRFSSGTMRFVEIERRLALVVSEAKEWQEYFREESFAEHADTSATLPIAFAFLDQPSCYRAMDVTFTLQQQYVGSAAAKLQLTCLHHEHAMTIELLYLSDTFSCQVVQRLAGEFQTLLSSILANPTLSLQHIEILNAEECQHLLIDVNQTLVDYPAERCFQQVFEEQVAATPDAIAVVFEAQHLSYREVNARANQLAHYLQTTLAVGTDSLVAVYLERMPVLITALLGILKAGGAYIPIDPSYPPSRIASMLAEMQDNVLLTTEHIAARLPDIPLQRVYLDRDWPTIAQTSQENPASDVRPERLAYVIYTSGSTGTPKGVMISQRGFFNYLSWCLDFYQIGAGSGSVVHSSIGFDLTVTSLFVPLCAGCTVFLAPEDEGIAGLLEILRQRPGLSLLKITPAHLALLSHVLTDEELPHVARVLVIGGEALAAEQLTRWRELAPTTRLINEYGPTETVVGCCIYEVLPTDPQTGTIPIGTPIANTQLYILDDYLRPVPYGVEGELYIGGAGVARGYRGQPDLTAERFVSSAWLHISGDRLYKSGDRARYRAAGGLEFLGRRDEQIKIRGYRIELGEIETVLGQHPTVRANAVVVQEDEAGNKRLIAYVVGTKATSAPIPDELRHSLQENLPDYMLPAAFVVLEALPLTMNGKVDRKALATLQRSHGTQKAVTITARSPIEELISTIWCALLGISQADIHDNFFTVGGHSLLATQLVSRVKTLLQVEVSLNSLFKQPTIAKFSILVEHALRDGQSVALPPFERVSRTDNLPLSFAQQRLWFLEQLEPGNTAYLIPIALRLHGPLHLWAFEQSLSTLIQRHETLRTTFALRQHHPTQVIHATGTPHLLLIDLSGLASDIRLATTQRLAEQEAHTACDLLTGPLLRIRLVHLAEQEHALFVTMHHIISDGWSSDLLQRELSVLYQAIDQGRPSPLTPLPWQYADYAHWQRRWLQGEILQTQLVYWKQQLNGLIPLALPIDHPRPPIQTFRGSYQAILLPTAFQEQLSALSQQYNVTLFMLLLTAFKVLLCHYSQQSDVSVGTPIANRTHEQTEGIVGFFVNILVLRTQVDDSLTFSALLQQVREVCLSAYTHQDIPFEQLVEALQPERDLSHSPLFQVMFILQQAATLPAEEAPDSFERLRTSALDIEQTTTKFDLTLNVASSMHGLRCGIEYNADLFDASTIQRYLAHWQILLEGIVTAPEKRLSELPIISVDERQALLFNANAISNTSYSEKTFLGLFAAQVARTPDAPAIVSKELTLSYSALDRYTNQLAHYLRSRGVGPEVLVGVSVERSATLIVCFLAILKAGGGYVPLDPIYPSARQQHILNDARLSLLLTTHTELAFSVPPNTNVITLPQLWSVLAQQPQTALDGQIAMDNVAYVIYTSGSTGTPKGVVVTHNGLGNLACVQAQIFQVQATSHVLQFASPNFDASISEIIVTLTAGASLYLAPQQCLFPGPELLTLLREWAINVVTLPPSALAVLPVEPLPALTTLVVAGEECPSTLPRRWAVDRCFYNAYGPTEATVCASIALHTVFPQEQQKISIGTPITNTQLYLLDKHLHLVPQGVAGELYIGGISLARGYVQQAGMTAECFLPHPFSSQPGARLYKTGDQARLRTDGMLEFLGRLDEQVKLRGYRIELGEIASILAEHPAVQDAVVLLHTTMPDNPQLVAYIASAQHVSLSSSQWRAYLQQRLPDYMLPARFVVLKSFPFTLTGKIDRRSLRASEQQGSISEPITDRVQTPLEELLCELWREVLGRSQIERHSNFFHIGGHSLLATQLVARIRTALRVDIPLQLLFEAPTLAEMARRIEHVQYQQQGIAMPPLVPVTREGHLPLSFAQQRLWLLNQLEPGNNAYTIPLIVVLAGDLQLQALEHSLDEIVRRHESLRTTFHVYDGQAVQEIRPACGSGLRHIDLRPLSSIEQGSALQHLTHQQIMLPFDLEHDMPIRCTLLHLDTYRYQLITTMQHIVADGWSNSILEYELNTLYRAYAAGTPSPLPELVIQYADFAIWQRTWLQGEVLQQQLTYWREQLAGAHPLNLPTDLPRSSASGQEAALQRFVLPAALSEELNALSRQEGTTLFMTLLAAFQVMLYRWSGQTDLVVGTDVANRTHVETEKLIGFFINLLVLRTQLQGNMPFHILLQAVREMVQAAYMHQQAPFELLAGQLQWERNRHQTPLVQVLFVLQNIPAKPSSVPAEITIRPVESEVTEAKFDLALFMSEEPDGLRAAIKYNSTLFKSETIETIIQRFAILLQDIVADSHTPLDLLRFHTIAEERHLTAQGKEHRLKLHSTKGKGIDLA
jgi:amino acid adenylation domain-containing protein